MYLPNTTGLIRTSVPIVCLLIFAVGCESNASAQRNIVSSFADLKKAILCLETASDQSGVRACLASHSVSTDSNPIETPKTPQDYQRQALMMWTAVARNDGSPLSSRHFDLAIEYASCIEDATLSLKSLDGDPRAAIALGWAKARMACQGQFFSTASMAKRHPDLLSGVKGNLPASEAKAYLLAGIFSKLTFGYVIETNGWVTEGMRPCVRYLDGRAPSASCAGEPQPIPPPPPR